MFAAADRFELVASAIDHIGPRVGVSYRTRLWEGGIWYTVEQHAYMDVKDVLIRSVDLLCSGFIRGSDEQTDPSREDPFSMPRDFTDPTRKFK